MRHDAELDALAAAVLRGALEPEAPERGRVRALRILGPVRRGAEILLECGCT